jgi:peptide-methionine (S)-S-oxide reductase
VKNVANGRKVGVMSESIEAVPLEAPAGLARAVFAAGCFWGVEDVFRSVPGVVDVAVGYTGGTLEHPTYQQVCGGRTGHAEAVLVTYDPTEVTFGALLDTFWRFHDPTTPNRQGPDVGTQYRSAVFFLDAVQEEEARRSAQSVQPRFRRPIVTEITPAGSFWRAEEYHQRYFAKHGAGGCHVPNWEE